MHFRTASARPRSPWETWPPGLAKYHGERMARRQHKPEQTSVCGLAWRACTEVTVTVFRMSATVHPRDRSLTGRVRPCSTGPIAMAPVLCCTACMQRHANLYIACSLRHRTRAAVVYVARTPASVSSCHVIISLRPLSVLCRQTPACCRSTAAPETEQSHRPEAQRGAHSALSHPCWAAAAPMCICYGSALAALGLG